MTQTPAPRSPEEIERRCAEIEARERAASFGPWKVYPRRMEWNDAGRKAFGDIHPPAELCIATVDNHPQLKAPLPIVTTADRPYCVELCGVAIDHFDAQFIANARADIPWLLSTLRESQRTLAVVRALVDEYAASSDVCANIALNPLRAALTARAGETTTGGENVGQ